MPAIVASANPAYAPAAASATVLVAASVVVTAVLTPLVTAWWASRLDSPNARAEHGRAGRLDAHRSVGIVADDLTGAADTGVAFLAAGLSVLVSWPDRGVERAWMSLADVLAVDTRSRAADAEYARGITARSWRHFASRRGHALQEIDSTLRGHVGDEVRAAIEAWHRSLAIVAPAFPADWVARPWTGSQCVDGVPLADARIRSGAVRAGWLVHLPRDLDVCAQRRAGIDVARMPAISRRARWSATRKPTRICRRSHGRRRVWARRSCGSDRAGWRAHWRLDGAASRCDRFQPPPMSALRTAADRRREAEVTSPARRPTMSRPPACGASSCRWRMPRSVTSATALETRAADRGASPRRRRTSS